MSRTVVRVDLAGLRAQVMNRLDLNASTGAHSVLAALVDRQRRYFSATDAHDHATARAELACLRYLVSSDELPNPARRRSLRWLVIAMLVFIAVAGVALWLRATDAEIQLEMCQRK